MKIAILTDMPRENHFHLEEAHLEDTQKMETVRSIKEILSKKYVCIDLVVDENIMNTLKNEKVDLVFNLCNGINGFSKLAQIPAMLEFANIPYTGSSILGHALAINKILSSTVFKSKNIPTPNYISIDSMSDLERTDMEFPILVKPSDEGSSRGIHQDSLVYNKEDLTKKVKNIINTYTPPIMLNEYIEGKELSIGIVGNNDDITILPIQEIDMSNLPDGLLKFYSFEIKSYYKSHTQYHLPARITHEEKEKIEKAVLKAYKSLSLKDYARVDIILKDGIPYILEINSLPGLMKNKSSLYRMAEASELGYEGLVFKIVDAALKRYGM
ncbi:MAG: ATP-grasp domain-containing protein [Tissierellaceae bacterium]|nr:ATP-grasp domain-containing protein [Tissierellaceae bacterium]